jgi:hypothetical protein
MPEHRCVFDSAFGFVPAPVGPALMCDCGRWSMPLFGEWQVVPKELLPSACAHLLKKRRWAEGGFLAAFAVIFLLTFWFL